MNNFVTYKMPKRWLVITITIFFAAGIFSCSESEDAMLSKTESVDEKALLSNLPGQLVITGNPESSQGAQWTYVEQGAVNYNLSGTLFKPNGSGPFPAVMINHGTGGNASANSYAGKVAKTMVTWGYVCIAVNYTHASSVPCGSPGLCVESDGEFGASESNILRGGKTLAILSSLAYVNTNRIVAFGHSRGAYMTTALAGTFPNRFKAFAHTAGGVSDAPDATTPTTTLASQINKPYLMHHGDNDGAVKIELEIDLANLLTRNHVINRLYIYPGYSHQDMSQDSTMYVRTKQWFLQYNK